jgi:mRNA-degrading endonuclease RelE of RelBE toxin-antitoxin system
MAKYSVTFTRSARKELEALDEKIVSVIFPKIENISLIPRPVGCRKLVGNHGYKPQSKIWGLYP